MGDRYDTSKNEANIRKQGVSFNDIQFIEWDSVFTTPDKRHDYNENRFVTYGLVNNRLHVLIWTPRNGIIRPISFRKANQRERRLYDQKIQS